MLIYYNFNYIMFLTIIIYSYFSLVTFNLYYLIYLNIYINITENSCLVYLNIYWTTLIYNYLFILFIFVICNFYKNIYFNKINVTLFWVFLFYLFNFIYNYSIDFYFFNQNINLLLINKLNSVHPPLIYLYNILILIIYYVFNYNYNYSEYIKCLVVLFYITTNVIYLGCWWSLQEDNWNEWWGWEFSEILSLVNLISCIILIHRRKFYKNLSQIYVFKNLIYWYLIINFLLVQIYLEDTMHNFINYLNLIVIFWCTSFLYGIKSFYTHRLVKLQLIYTKVLNFFTIINVNLIIIYFINFIYLYLYWYINNTFKSVEYNYSIYIYCLFFLATTGGLTLNIQFTYLIKYHLAIFLIIHYLTNSWNFQLNYVNNLYLLNYDINTVDSTTSNLTKSKSFYYNKTTIVINNVLTEFYFRTYYYYSINLLFIIHLWLLNNTLYCIYIYIKNSLWY